jgi:hypothetical protein
MNIQKKKKFVSLGEMQPEELHKYAESNVEIPEEILQAILDDTDDVQDDVNVEAVINELELEMIDTPGGSLAHHDDHGKSSSHCNWLLDSNSQIVHLYLYCCGSKRWSRNTAIDCTRTD